ncbi:MAG: class I SAM-dependent methyltransferase [Spirochaetales bacterium]|nr:class I SAM-dependent methyltransferase [Spirochaetales bacterium]
MRFLLLSAIFTIQCSAIMPRIFNWEAQSADSQPEEILRVLQIQPGWNVADIGSGGGYFSYRFAEATGPTGQVLAVDVNAEYLAFVASQAESRGLTWIQTVQASPDNSGLAPASLDLAFCRNVYHHLPEDRSAYFAGLRPALKRNGLLAIIDYKKSGSNFAIWTGHHTEPERIQADLRSAGFALTAEHSFLEDQSFLIFKLADL